MMAGRMAEALCPICKRSLKEAAPKPFCSARCRQIDLGSWLGGDYRIAGAPVDPHAEADQEEPG